MLNLPNPKLPRILTPNLYTQIQAPNPNIPIWLTFPLVSLLPLSIFTESFLLDTSAQKEGSKLWLDKFIQSIWYTYTVVPTQFSHAFPSCGFD